MQQLTYLVSLSGGETRVELVPQESKHVHPSLTITNPNLNM